MASMDDLKKRFRDEVKLRAYDDRYIDKNEEREILQIAITLGISIDSARTALIHVCEKENYVIESVLLKMMKDQIEAAFVDDGKMDEKEFDLIFINIRKAADGKKTDRELKRMILQQMEETGYTRVKTGWFSNWYDRLRKELGMS